MGYTPGQQPAEIGPANVLIWTVPLARADKRGRKDLAHVAQRQILADLLKIEPEAVEYAATNGGKPMLVGEPLQFSLTHSGTLALLAVTRELPVGIDVQAPHPALTKPWFAKRICTEREYAKIGEAGDPQALLRLWVRKEAVIKARGEGSFLDAGEIDVLDDELDGGWLCRDLPQPGRGYRAAVAVRNVEGLTLMRPGGFIP